MARSLARGFLENLRSERSTPLDLYQPTISGSTRDQSRASGFREKSRKTLFPPSTSLWTATSILLVGSSYIAGQLAPLRKSRSTTSSGRRYLYRNSSPLPFTSLGRALKKLPEHASLVPTEQRPIWRNSMFTSSAPALYARP